MDRADAFMSERFPEDQAAEAESVDVIRQVAIKLLEIKLLVIRAGERMG